MPRNKKNKNRNGQSTATASNTSKIGSVSTQPNSGAKNDTLNVANKIVPIQEITADQIRDNTISIDDAKSKLSQLQESVDTIKASISQLNATNENTTTELTENTGIVTDAKPFESNTVKRKRNRNRNKKKNGGGTDENSPDAAEKNTSIDQNLAQEIAEIPTVQSAEVINQSNTEQIAKSIENEIKLDLPIADKSVSKAITPVESKKSPKQTKKQNNSHGQKQDITKEKENESKDMKLSNVNEAQRNTSNQSPQQTKRRIISTEKIKSESVIVVQTEKCDKLKALEENELTIKTVPKKFEQIDVGNIKQQSATSTLEIKTETNKGQQSKEPKKSNKQKSKSDTSTIVNVSLLDSELNKELVEIKDESKSLSIEIKPEATVKSDKNSIQLIPKSAPLKNSDDNLASNANEKMSIDDPVVIATQQSVIDKITKSDPVHATKKCTNNQLIDCNLLLEAIVEKSANVALLSSDIVIKEQTSITESTPKSKQIEQEQRGQVTAMPTNELIIETLDIKKPSLQEDATSKIWKILEEASKSLEPVEIEMEDDPISSDNINVSKETTVSVSTENVESANNESEQLKSVLVPKDIETEDDKNVCSTSTSARLTEVESKKLPKMSKCESDKAPSASKEKQNETHNKNDLKVEDVISSAKIVSSDVENIVSKNETITVNTEIDAAATAKPVAEIPKIDTINLNIESAAFKAGASKSNTDSITLKSEATTSKIENITSNATKKELISSKPVETQPRKSDQKKKEHKLQKNVRTNKATQQLPPEKHPINETVPIPDIEIPLDMSIISTDGLDQPASDLLNLPLPMCDDKETTEQLSDSKNVQGSDFVPSVKQLADATKSLVTEIIISEPIRTIETKSNSPATEKRNKNEINLKQSQDTLETKIYELPEKNFAEKLSLEPQVTDIKLVDMLEAKMTEPNLNAKKQEITVKIPKPETSSAVISINKDAATDIVATPKEIEQINAKQLEQKPKILPKPKTAVKPKVLQSVSPSPKSKSPQNEKKSSNKPNVPPKPEHLISSKDKSKSPTAVAKVSNTTKFTAPIPLSDDDDEEEDFIEYKFMPRQVFICTICQSCKVPLQPVNRILCQLCQMVTYCSTEHLTNDEPSHKELCSAIQEIAKKRGGHIYNNARILNNNDYRSLRVHTLNICENLLKRPLQTYEREILLFPRLCSTTNCREWRQNLLSDCTICRQVSHCTTHPVHLVDTHQRWCNAFALYQKLVVKQSVSGRIEPSLPSKILTKPYTMPNNIDDVFKELYKNYSAAIQDDCVHATLTQLATAPLTAYFAAQQAERKIGEKFTIHLVGAELQFEADILDIWETFFLHLAHKLMDLTIVFCGPELNAENIPLDILSRIRMCRTCRQNCRIVKFDFQCAKLYHDYANGSSFKKPDLICFFNPGLYRITGYNGLDTWPETIKVVTNLDCPIVITSYTEYESPLDLERFQAEADKCGDAAKQMTIVHAPQINHFSSQRPERNFISDEVAPLIFKNFYCFVLK